MLKHPPHPSEFSVLSHILKKGFFKFSLHLFSLPIPFLSSCICSLSACHTIVTASLPPRCFFVEITTRGALKATFANIRLPLSLYSDPSIPILHFRAGFDICRRGAAGSRSHQHQPSTCLYLRTFMLLGKSTVNLNYSVLKSIGMYLQRRAVCYKKAIRKEARLIMLSTSDRIGC